MPFAGLNQSAARLAECVKARATRIVCAESCTGGLVSAALAQIPGISEFHCGSAVVYRLDTKTQWLDVPAAILLDPGPVSDVVARAMVAGVLHHTPAAEWAAAITGHLGPHAPVEQDGLVYIGIGRRQPGESTVNAIAVTPHHLGDPHPLGTTPEMSLRVRRQIRAAELVLETLTTAIVAS